MVLFWITLLVAVTGTNAEGELCVLHTPDSLTFIPTIETWEGHLKEIYSAALGLSVEYYTEWKGMYIMDPFATPEAVVEVHVDGVPSLSEYSGMNIKIFPLIVDESEPHTFKGLQSRIKQHSSDGRNQIVNVKLYNEKRHLVIRRAFGNSNVTDNEPNPPLMLKHLNKAVDEDRYFLQEFETLQTIIGKIRSGALNPDNLIDFYHFRFRTLHVLSDFYGPISIQTNEAKQLLGDALQELNEEFVKAYDGSVLVTVVTTDVAHTRRSARSVTNPPDHSKKWPYEWLEPPLDWKKNPLKPTPPGRRENPEETDNAIKNFGPKIFENDNLEIQPPAKRADDDDENEPGKSGGTKEENNNGEKKGSTEEVTPTSDDSRTSNADYLKDTMRIEDEDDEDAYKYQKPDDSYAMFNIILWLSVVMGFSMLAIIYACMDMDPGRDTIIYRLTNMRTKKEM